MRRRVLFYVQHLLGVGHLKRAEILAGAMQEAGLEVTVALGGRPLAEASFRSVSTVQLPPATIANENFSTLLDGDRRPVDQKWKAGRAAALTDLYRRTDPDVLLLELFPFGRRQFRFELLPLLEHVRRSARPACVACSVRDILVASKKPGQDSATAELVRRHFDAVLVHGDPALIPFEATFTEAARIADLIRYTGYVAAPLTPAEPAGGSGEVLVSAGGGAVGSPVLFAALAASALNTRAQAADADFFGIVSLAIEKDVSEQLELSDEVRALLELDLARLVALGEQIEPAAPFGIEELDHARLVGWRHAVAHHQAAAP